ncbi:MAG: scytonemin biosynthesis PEP-CTERM protein ScyF [Cyanobacteria bacterium J06554_3]
MKLLKLCLVAIATFTPFALTTLTAKAVTITFDSSVGSPGFGPGELFVPQGVGVGPDNNVYVANGRGIDPLTGEFVPEVGNKIEVFSPDGEYLRSVGIGGKGIGELDEPGAIKFDPTSGNLYVGDVFNSEIDIYDPLSGDFVGSFGSFSGQVANRPFFGPGGFDFDAKGDIYVPDFSGDEIKVYNRAGELTKTIGTSGSAPGEFLGPAAVGISDKTGNLYITDQFNNRIQVLNSDGDFLFAFGTEGTDPGQFNEPIGLDVDESDNIYVADSQNGRVQVFDSKGNFLAQYGEPARSADGKVVPPPMLGEAPFGDPLVLEPGVFNWTAGLEYEDETLYVGDFFQGRVQILNVDNIGTDGNNKASVPEPGAIIGILLVGTLGLLSHRDNNRDKTEIA